jgi:hypothetical protein
MTAVAFSLLPEVFDLADRQASWTPAAALIQPTA